MITPILKKTVLSIIILVLAVVISSCNQPKKPATPADLPDLPVQKEKAVTQTVEAKKGGWIYYNDAYQELAVYFPPGSLAKNTEIVLTPIQRLSVGVSDIIDAGFVVEEKGTKKAPELKKPVALAFKMPDSDPNVTIFKYQSEDGVYTPLPSRLISSRGSHILMTGVTSFSAYGVKVPDDKDAKTIKTQKETLYIGTLTVAGAGAAPMEINSDTGKTTITSTMNMTVTCPEAVIRGGVYKGECSVSAEAVWTETLMYNLSGSASMDYLLPSKSTDRPKTLPTNLREKVESRAEARGFLEFGADAAGLAILTKADGADVPVDFLPSEDGMTWPFKAFMVPGTDEALVVTAFGFYMGKYTSGPAAK